VGAGFKDVGSRGFKGRLTRSARRSIEGRNGWVACGAWGEVGRRGSCGKVFFVGADP